MKIAVVGLWHLGSVTAACLADQSDLHVIGFDPDVKVVDALNKGVPPLYEPGLAELVKKGLAARRLSFTADPAMVATADIVWVTVDTPVDDEDKADVGAVTRCVESLFPHFRERSVVLISSQVPAGTTGALRRAFHEGHPGKTVFFAYTPENLRLGKAIDVFTRPERIVVGTNDAEARALLAGLLERYTANILWMRTESAEMVKHSLNAFLAVCVTFINEIAEICESVGADSAEVERGLRSEPRVGAKAYVKPGSAFAGGTLARDINYLCLLADHGMLTAPLLQNVLSSNNAHKQWIGKRLRQHLKDLRGKNIAILGLAYTPGTDTLRRSFAIELCRELHAQGCVLRAFDPHVKNLPPDLAGVIALSTSAAEVAQGADALIVASEHPDFKRIGAEAVRGMAASSVVIDQNGWLEPTAVAAAAAYVRLGEAA